MNVLARVRDFFCCIACPPVPCRRPKKGAGISLLVPFRTDNGRREETWAWLRSYWEYELPGAEIVIGSNDDVPFCKTRAVNDAARRASGDIFVIMDADCYLPGVVLRQCAEEIREAQVHGNALWYMPYRQSWRINDAGSRLIMASGHATPKTWFFASPPPASMIQDHAGSASGHWYGALVQVMPSEGFWVTGGMDERFRGWGGEDISFMHAMDTLYGKHKTTRNGVLHLWHERLGTNVHDRTWLGQVIGSNSALATRYHKANGDFATMWSLTREWQEQDEAADGAS